MTENQKNPAYSYYALGLLAFVYVMNFLDRQIIYILFPLIKKEWAFTDTQLALLGGTSFAIFIRFWESLSGGWRINARGRN